VSSTIPPTSSDAAPSAASGETVSSIPVSSERPGFRTYTNARFGFRFDYPRSLLVKVQHQDGNGIQLVSKDGAVSLLAFGFNNPGTDLATAYNSALQAVKGELGYHVMAGTWFVIKSKHGDNLIFEKGFLGKGSETTFLLSYPESQKNEYQVLVAQMEDSFEPGDLDHAW
jgi:hypothetical protein